MQLAVEYAQEHGLILDEELTFEDLGVSAFHGKQRTAGRLGEFELAVMSGVVPHGSYLLIESLDRLTREQVADAMYFFLGMLRHGVSIVTLSDGHLYSHEKTNDIPTDLIVATALMIRANDESVAKSRRHLRNWNQKRLGAEQRKPMTKWCPSWLKLSDDRTEYIVIPERADVVRRIFRDYLAGASPYIIARDLNVDGIPHFNGKQWQTSYITKILHSPTTIGTFTPHMDDRKDGKRRRIPLEPIPNYYPAVIDEATYANAQSLTSSSPISVRGKSAERGVVNIFAGLARCPLCGMSMTLTNKYKGTTRYLVCNGSRSGKKCSHRTVRYDLSEETFLDNIANILVDFPSQNDTEELLRQEIIGLEAEQDRLTDAAYSLARAIGAIDPPIPVTMTKELRKLEADIQGVIEQIRAKTALFTGLTGPILKGRLTRLDEVTKENPIDRGRVNSALRQLATSIVFDWQTGLATITWKGKDGSADGDGSGSASFIYDGRIAFAD